MKHALVCSYQGLMSQPGEQIHFAHNAGQAGSYPVLQYRKAERPGMAALTGNASFAALL
jgi:hypothetical protein